jgi:hypothetical protein
MVSELSSGSAIFVFLKLSFSALQDFRTSGFCTSGLWVLGFRSLGTGEILFNSPFQPPTSEILFYLILSGLQHNCHHLPKWCVARFGGSLSHSVTSLGSHHSRFSFRPSDTRYISMCPHPFLEKSNGQIFLTSDGC